MRRAYAVAGLVAMLAGGGRLHGAQRGARPPAPQSTGAISGVVVDGSGRPIGGAVVMLGTTGRGPLRPSRQLTDSKGRFVFLSLPPSDQYFLNASKFGFLDGGYGRRGPEIGSRIVLAEGEWFSSARIVLRRPGAITGSVLDEQGDPVVGVPVRVISQILVGGRPQLAAGPATTTDDRGMYRIGGLTPGRYLVTVPSVQVAMPAASSTQVTQPANARSETPPAPAIVKGTERLALGPFATPPPPATRSWAYPITFHPNAPTVSEATVIDLDYGQERSGISVQLQPVPTSSMSGTVTGPTDVTSGLVLRLLPAGSEGLGVGSEAATAVVSGDGTFMFLNVPAGQYTILASRTTSEFTTDTATTGNVNAILPTSLTGQAASLFMLSAPAAPPGTAVSSRSAAGSDAWSGRTNVAVEDRDVAGVVVTLRQGATVSGSFSFEMSADLRTLLSFSRTVFAEPADPSSGATVRSGSSQPSQLGFSISGLIPGDYLLRVPGTDAMVKSITWSGRDYSNAPIDASAGREITGVVIRLTDKVPRLSGALQDESGRPAPDAAAIAFPVEKDQWTGYGLSPSRIKSTPADSAGRYEFTTLPAGDYYVIAVDASERDAWQDPRFFETVQSSATRVALSWGGVTTQDLRKTRLR